jgi:hypothetical protein
MDDYQFLDGEEVEFTHDDKLPHRYWFFFHDTGITMKQGWFPSRYPEVLIHPHAALPDVSKAILVLFKTATSGNLPFEGMVSKLLRILLPSFGSIDKLAFCLDDAIGNFATINPIARTKDVLEFLKQTFPEKEKDLFHSWTWSVNNFDFGANCRLQYLGHCQSQQAPQHPRKTQNQPGRPEPLETYPCNPCAISLINQPSHHLSLYLRRQFCQPSLNLPPDL